MIDTDRYEIDDDVVWIWNDSFDAYDEEKKKWVNGIEHANWQLWEYKECPAEKGGYKIYRKGENDESTHEPWNQLLPDMASIEWHKKMEAIQDVPFLIREIKRAYQLIVDAAWQLHWNVGTIASSAHLSNKEWDEDIYAPAQAWRRQVQDILDASKEGCPWKESEGDD